MNSEKENSGTTPDLNSEFKRGRLASFRLFSGTAGLVVAAVGASVLVGWALDVAALQSVFPGLVTMKANTAAAFLLAGVALALLGREAGSPAARRLGQLCALVVAFLGLLTLGEYAFGADFGIDQLLFRESVGAVATSSPGRMAPATALNFLLCGGGLLLLEVETRRRRRPAQFLALTAGVISLLALIGYAYSVVSLYRLASYTGMALHTSVTFIVLSLGVVCARPERGVMAWLVAKRAPPAAADSPAGRFSHVAEWMTARPARSYLVFLLAAVLPLGLFFYLASNMLHEQLEERSRRVGTQTALLSAQLVEERFRQSTAFLEAFASRPLLRQGLAARDAKVMTYHLKIAYDLQPDFAFFSVYDLDGTMRGLYPPAAGVVGRNFADRDWYRGVSRNWKPYVSEVYRTAVAPGPLVVAVAVPLKEPDGTRTGILMAPYTVSTIAQWMGQIQQEGAWRISVVDQHGRLLAGPGADPFQPPLELGSYPPVARLQAGQSGTGFFSRGDEEFFVAYTPIGGLGWGLLAERRQALVLQSAQTVERQLGLLAMVFTGLALAGGALVAWLQTRLARARDAVQAAALELNRSNTELQATNKELEAFTYSVSHDLRAPLRHIDGFSRLLLEEHSQKLPDEARHYLERVRQGTRQMGNLVDDLLNLSRVGRQELRRQVTGLKSLVEEAQQEMKGELEGRAVEWRIGELPFADCDPTLMKQVFTNLLSNAVKFTRPRPAAVIEIGAHTENGEPTIFVRDNGVGFSMKYADKLFGVFQRLHRPEDFEGTGVGLATVERIIHKHGGRVWAHAELDKGATFYFTVGEGGSGGAQTLGSQGGGQ